MSAIEALGMMDLYAARLRNEAMLGEQEVN
jgi:hypothetical protein